MRVVVAVTCAVGVPAHGRRRAAAAVTARDIELRCDAAQQASCVGDDGPAAKRLRDCTTPQASARRPVLLATIPMHGAGPAPSKCVT